MGSSLSKKSATASRSPSQTLVVAFTAGLLLFLLASFLTGGHRNGINGDLAGYMNIALDIQHHRLGSDGLYYHFHHYPPLANLLFLVAQLNAFTLPYDWGLLFTVLIAGVSGLLFIFDSLKPDDARWTFLAILISIGLLEPTTFFARYDFFPMFCMMLCALCLRRERWTEAGAFLGAAVMLKFAPVFLIPLALAMTPKSDRLRIIGGMAIAFIGTWILCDLIIGPGETLKSLIGFAEVRQSQPPYIFSTAASIDLFVKKLIGSKATVVWLDPNLGHFVSDMPVILPTLLQILSVAGTLVIAWIGLKDRKRREHLMPYFAATIFWLLFATPFTTMHYYLWGLPFAFLWFLEETDRTGKPGFWTASVAVLAAAVSLIGQYCFPYGYYDLVLHQSWLPVLLNMIRNCAVLALCIACLKAARSPEASRS